MRSRMVSAGLLGAAFVVTSVVWSAQDAKHAEAQVSSPLDGIYIRVAASASTEDVARNRAIVQATASLPTEARNLWRGLLEEIARPSPRMELRRESEDLVVKDSGRVELRSAATGASREVEGGWQLDQRIVAGVLVQHIESDDVAGEQLAQPLRQTLRYTLSGDQQRLTVQTRIEGGELPAAIVFSVTYRRS